MTKRATPKIIEAACVDLARLFLQGIEGADDMDLTELAEALEERGKEFCSGLNREDSKP